MTNEAYAYFAIYGDFDPKAITLTVGVEPTEVWVKGEVVSNGRQRPDSKWTLRSKLGLDKPLEAHIANVLAQLDANSDAFQSISRQFGGGMQLVAEFHDYPGVHFERDIVEGLALYALSVDFDFYYLGSP
jgi:hypothetical protein